MLPYIPILQRRTNLLRLYGHICGTSQVPYDYHVWACLSLIAACVKDNVWLEKLKGSKLTPKLYVALIGPPAVGKGVAINHAVKIMRASYAASDNNIYYGKTTAAYLIDKLGKDGTSEEGEVFVSNPRKWVVSEELGACVGKKDADDLVKLMTMLYTNESILDTGTRGKGGVRIENSCVNWLLGTTEKWLVDTFTLDAIESGFWSRIVAVVQDRTKKRYYRPIYPSDYQQVYEHILTRFWMLHHIKGEFEMTDNAINREKFWYANRKEPRDSSLLPSWDREHDLLLKLAMLMSLADNLDLVIQENHISRAIAASESVQKWNSRIIRLFTKTPALAIRDIIVETLKGYGEEYVQHSKLSNRVRNRGIDAKQLREIMSSMFSDREVVSMRSPSGARMYKWVGDDEKG